MKIFSKEVLSFTQEERKALNLVREICIKLNREASDPNLRKLAAETQRKLMELWGYEDED